MTRVMDMPVYVAGGCDWVLSGEAILIKLDIEGMEIEVLNVVRAGGTATGVCCGGAA